MKVSSDTIDFKGNVLHIFSLLTFDVTKNNASGKIQLMFDAEDTVELDKAW